MRYIFVFSGILLILLSCNDGKKGQGNAAVKQDTTFLPVKYDYKKLENIYLGDFGGADIHISLRHVNGRRAMGYSIHKGLKRNFSGSMKPEGAGFRFKLSEPGNNPYDGTFDFVLDTTTFGIKGSWVPNDIKTLKTKDYVLTKANDTFDNYVPPFNDSIGGFIFEKNGLCTYETYRNNAVDSKAPLVIAKGNWIKRGDVFIIDWEPNAIFPSRKMSFKIEKDFSGDPADSVYIRYLPLDGRKLYSHGESL